MTYGGYPHFVWITSFTTDCMSSCVLPVANFTKVREEEEEEGEIAAKSREEYLGRRGRSMHAPQTGNALNRSLFHMYQGGGHRG